MCSTTWSTALLDAALEAERVGAGGDVLQALADDRLGEHGRGGGAVAGDVVGRRGDLADELGALVLEDVLDLDLTSDGHAVVRDRRGAELLVEDDVAAPRAERDLDRVGDGVDAGLEGLARLDVVLEFLVSHLVSPRLSLALDLGEDVGLAQDQQVLAVDLDLRAAVLGVQDLVALGDVERDALAVRRRACRRRRRGPCPSGASPWRCRGGRCPIAVVSSSSTALTISRSPRGLSFIR